jgi:hypothetical protein
MGKKLEIGNGCLAACLSDISSIGGTGDRWFESRQDFTYVGLLHCKDVMYIFV